MVGENRPADAQSAGIAPGTLCPGHIHVPGAHYTISLVKECRFVVKGCRFASVREKCICYIWVGSSSIWEIGDKRKITFGASISRIVRLVHPPSTFVLSLG